MVKKYWLHIALAFTLGAWVSQLLWNNNSDAVVNEITAEPVKKQNGPKRVIPDGTIRLDDKPSLIKVVRPEEPEDGFELLEENKDADITSDQEFIEYVAQSRNIHYQKISGYPLIAEVIAQNCGNLIDTELEKKLVDVYQLSGQEIFVSEHFCMHSAIWQKFERIAIIEANDRTESQLKTLQKDYDELLNTLSSDSEKILATKAFVQQMSEHYHLFPTRDLFGKNHYQLGVLVQSKAFNRGDVDYYRVKKARFKLFNKLEIPEYVFKDVLDTNSLSLEQETIEPYQEQIATIFVDQKTLFTDEKAKVKRFVKN